MRLPDDGSRIHVSNDERGRITVVRIYPVKRKRAFAMSEVSEKQLQQLRRDWRKQRFVQIELESA